MMIYHIATNFCGLKFFLFLSYCLESKFCDPEIIYENNKFLDHGNLELYGTNILYTFVNSILLTGSEH